MQLAGKIDWDWIHHKIAPLYSDRGRPGKALPDNPYDGHTISALIDATEKLTGCVIERAYVDKSYRGHDKANRRRVFISGRRRGVTKRELRGRTAIEAAIGHLKTDGQLGRCYLKSREGDAANVILTAVGYNLRRVAGET